MYNESKLWVGINDAGEKICLLPKMANRHGLVAGATGTGKTVTLKVLAESFSDMGVPVFMADVKGTLQVFQCLEKTVRICKTEFSDLVWQKLDLDLKDIQ